MTAPGTICYYDGRFGPLAEARVPITTHAFNYGTGCFEGIRAYWNEAAGCLQVIRLPEHVRRLANSARVLRLQCPDLESPERAQEVICELLRRNAFRTDVYIRPIVYKSGSTIQVTLSGIESDWCVYAVGMGDYVDTKDGLDVLVSTWRRIDDNAIPARAKPTGAYLNAALASDEARSRGAAEAIMLTGDGHVAEAASSNLFVVEDGILITSPVSDDVLVGITRDCVLRMARSRSLAVEERRIDRSELFVADEAFLCGTGVQIAPVRSVDGRPIGGGRPGPVTTMLRDWYQQIVRGQVDDFSEWRTPIAVATADGGATAGAAGAGGQ